MKRKNLRLREVSSRTVARQVGSDVARASFARGVGDSLTLSQWGTAICGAGLPRRWARVAGRAAVRVYARERVKFTADLSHVLNAILEGGKPCPLPSYECTLWRHIDGAACKSGTWRARTSRSPGRTALGPSVHRSTWWPVFVR